MAALTKIEINEPTLYHDSSKKGTFSILQVVNGEKKQRTYLLKDLEKALQKARESNTDTWICQNDFNRFNRKIINLERINVVFSDLDTYNSKYKDDDEEFIKDELIKFCNNNSYPIPSVMVFSGRGIQIKWILKDSLTVKYLPAWKNLQKGICKIFEDFGADNNALDAARLLRLDGTINSKSKKVARVLSYSNEITKYTFEQLVERFNIDVEEEVVIKKEKEKKPKLAKEKFKLIIEDEKFVASNQNNKEGNKANLEHKSLKKLNWCRFVDLRTLVDLRGGVEEGYRMKFLFWSVNFMSQSLQINVDNFWSEVEALAERFYPKGDFSRTDLNTIYEKVCANQRGEKIIFEGKKYTNLYTPTNSTLLAIFNITEQEQKHMITIISKTEKAERHRLREEERRRSNGAKSQKDSNEKNKPWEILGISRRTYYRNKNK